MTDAFGHGCVSGCHDQAASSGRGAAAARQADWTQLRADVDNSSWDGPAAMSACSSSDTPASCYGAICAGKKAGDPALQSSHALPHHKKPGDPPNHNGVANALARLDQTEGLTNKAEAKAHLEAHMSAINGSGANMSGLPAELRAAAYQGQRRGTSVEPARMAPFRAWYQREDVLVNGKPMTKLDGYASVTGVEYDMWDMFGPYWEQIDPRAFDATLAKNPDVAFLVNHKGITMARTTNQTLTLDVDPRGLHSSALVNPGRTDVRDLLIAIDDKNVTEMSFAFMIDDGEWDEDFMHFRILAVDIDRGDVSAVNYGANPYTSIGARARDILHDVDWLPRGAQVAAYERLSVKLGHTAPVPRDLHTGHPVGDEDTDPRAPVVVEAQQPGGKSIAFIEALLEL